MTGGGNSLNTTPDTGNRQLLAPMVIEAGFDLNVLVVSDFGVDEVDDLDGSVRQLEPVNWFAEV